MEKSLKLLVIILLVFISCGCDLDKKVRLDVNNQRNKDDVIEFTRNALRKRYNEEFDVTITKEMNLKFISNKVDDKNTFDIKGGNSYQLYAKGKNTKVGVNVEYRDAFYCVDNKYCDKDYYPIEVKDNYLEMIELKNNSTKMKDIASLYFNNEELIKYDFLYDKATIYLNYKSTEMDKSLFAKLLFIAIDYADKNSYVIFKDAKDALNSIYKIELLYRNFFSQNEINDKLDSNLSKLHNTIYEKTKGKIDYKSNGAKASVDDLLKVSQYFFSDKILDVVVKDMPNNNYYLEIHCKTKNDVSYKITSNIVYDHTKSRYVLKNVSIWTSGIADEKYLLALYDCSK